MAVYLTDANLTDRIPTNLTNTVIDDATKRTDKCITPATAIIDAILPGQSPFADIAATPATPTIINSAAICYALMLAHRLLAKNPDDPQAVTWEKAGDKIMRLDEKGVSQLVLSSSTQVGFPEMTRDLDDERSDEQSVVQ
jgi:hypothetical protein